MLEARGRLKTVHCLHDHPANNDRKVTLQTEIAVWSSTGGRTGLKRTGNPGASPKTFPVFMKADFVPYRLDRPFAAACPQGAWTASKSAPPVLRHLNDMLPSLRPKADLGEWRRLGRVLFRLEKRRDGKALPASHVGYGRSENHSGVDAGSAVETSGSGPPASAWIQPQQ